MSCLSTFVSDTQKMSYWFISSWKSGYLCFFNIPHTFRDPTVSLCPLPDEEAKRLSFSDSFDCSFWFIVFCITTPWRSYVGWWGGSGRLDAVLPRTGSLSAAVGFTDGVVLAVVEGLLGAGLFTFVDEPRDALHVLVNVVLLGEDCGGCCLVSESLSLSSESDSTTISWDSGCDSGIIHNILSAIVFTCS